MLEMLVSFESVIEYEYVVSRIHFTWSLASILLAKYNKIPLVLENREIVLVE